MQTTKPRIVVFSATDEPGVRRLATAYLEHLSTLSSLIFGEEEGRYLDDLAFTLCAKRDAFPWKSFTAASSLSGLVENLERELTNTARSTSSGLKLGFVFTGQGAQGSRMGVELNLFGVFRNSLVDSDAYL
jgi:acyl transferase domain-containing protein